MLFGGTRICLQKKEECIGNFISLLEVYFYLSSWGHFLFLNKNLENRNVLQATINPELDQTGHLLRNCRHSKTPRL